jgi:hypothetical protein
MQKQVEKQRTSLYRQLVHKKHEEVKRLYLKAAFEDLLLAGTPVETYKTCGKPTCKCSAGGEQRHGPYLAVQVRRDGKQRNLTLKKSERRFFEMAQHYQYQLRNRKKIVELQNELMEEFDKMIEARTIWDKE